MPDLVLIIGPDYPGEINLPGYRDRMCGNDTNLHIIPGFSTIPQANAAGFRYYRRRYASSWHINGGQLQCWNTGEYCTYPKDHELYRLTDRPCEFCVWITARNQIFDVIGDRPVMSTTATPAIDGRGHVYGWRCHSSNHVWTIFEDADKCCTGKFQRGLGEWIPIPIEVL